jgi:enoyl-CoA hydratase
MSAANDYVFLEITRDGPIATVTLDRPDNLNALNQGLMRELTRAAEAFHDDTETRVVIFTGRGKHFCAGMDLRDRPDSDAGPRTRLDVRRALKLGPALIRAIHEMNAITIAAVNGGALGGGACITTACDFRIGAEGSFVGYPEINLGMNLQWVALPLCVHLVGPARAKRMIMLGNKESAETLLDWGFYDDVVPADELLDAAKTLAHAYAAQPPMAAQMIKQSINAVSSALDRAIMHMDHDQWLLTASTADYQEGVGAFFEKRPPKFTGN